MVTKPEVLLAKKDISELHCKLLVALVIVLVVMSWSRSWCHKNANNLLKTKNWSRKQSPKVDRIRVGRIRKFPFLPILFMVSFMTQ